LQDALGYTPYGFSSSVLVDRQLDRSIRMNDVGDFQGGLESFQHRHVFHLGAAARLIVRRRSNSPEPDWFQKSQRLIRS
jgi:hypothetical protein